MAKGDQLKIYDLAGKLVYQNNTITDQILRIDLANVEPGLYNVLVISGEDVKTTKLLKVE
ncbi:MAG: T9SS type A sorting domain-containing protein [Saprospiraceae bacterium]|nr:T9SS type A sorting domain-containing protein [Saprospiraceae bacterium]